MTDFNSLEPQATFDKFFGRPTLDRFDGENGIEILINGNTGESFCSVRGYARMANKSVSTISERLPIGDSASNMSQIHTNGGLQGVRLITEDQIVEWLPKDNPIAASHLLKMGVRMGLHKMAGYSISSTAVKSTAVNPEPDEFAEMRARVELAKSLAGNPGAIEAYKSLFHAPQPLKPPSSPPPAPPKPKIPTSADIVKDFLAKLDILAEKGLVGEWNVTPVKRKLMPCTAVHLSVVWHLVLRHFEPSYDRVTLHSAILARGGEIGSTQKFLPKAGGIKKTEQRRCVLIPIVGNNL
jgi:hypothetical protein